MKKYFNAQGEKYAEKMYVSLSFFFFRVIFVFLD